LNKRETLALILVCVVSAGIGYGGYRVWQARAATEAAELRPDLEFRDIAGKAHRLSEWDGKLLLLNFWATWCAPCLKEIPLLVEAQQRHGARGLQIVGIAMDEAEPVRRFAEHLRMNYPIMVGQAEISRAMDELGDQLGALPFSVLIAPDGRIVDRISGDLSREELQGLLDRYLPEGSVNSR
jgi:thiol-disulfide isomerase/thioredoxin